MTPSKRKCVLVLLDGLGDRTYASLGGRTPLAAAKTPTLDRIAAGGGCGLFHATRAGEALPSETAHFLLFGYDLSEFPGRGALEALGAGIPLRPGQVAILAHFAVLREDGGILYMVDNEPKGGDARFAPLFAQVEAARFGGISFRLRQTGGCWGILVLDGRVSRYITDTDPIADGAPLIEPEPWAAAPDPSVARQTARALKAYLMYVRQSLTAAQADGNDPEPPIGGIVTQRAGTLKKVEAFSARTGLQGLSLASGLVYAGLARCIGMDFEKTADTGDPGADLAGRLGRAAAALSEGYTFVHVHTKAPDQAAHTKDPAAKVAAIESLDRGIAQAVAPLLEDPEVLVVVTADHSTPSAGPLVHSGEPVPLVFSGAGVRKDRVSRFDEVSCAPGALGFLRGQEMICMILNHLDRVKMAGLMDTPVDQPYWPGDIRPFSTADVTGRDTENA